MLSRITGILAVTMALLGCSRQAPPDSHPANAQSSAEEARTALPSAAGSNGASPVGTKAASSETTAGKPASGAPRPFLAVNTVDALLPLGRSRGRLAVSNGCVTFKLRDQLYTPIWPEGTSLSEDGTRILGTAGETFPLGEDVTLDGAAFSLANDSMRLGTALPGRCPNATYAVNL